jgi:metallo-beta-lactamase family protein
MKIKFLGAAGTVTGSGYVVTSESGQSVLVDLGMFQGPAAIEQLNYKQIDFDFSRLSGMVLTHAHLDHCGRLPVIFSHGFKGQVWMTEPTAELTEVVLFDSAKIARQDEREILYDKQLVENSIKAFKKVKYDVPFTIGDFTVVLREAGHILGSASVEIEDRSGKEIRKIVFSGDLGNPAMDLLPPAAHISSADVVVMESTYGDRLHPTEDPTNVLVSEIKQIEASGGTLLIPAFSLEKTQEILHWLKKLKIAGKIKTQTPIFLDSPMALRATRIYQNYPPMFNTTLQMEFKNSNPFEFPGLEIIESQESRGFIEKERGAKVIIAGSGMMMGGRILAHSIRYLPNKINRLLLVGYQGEETLGREIMEGSKSVTIDGASVNIRASISHTQAMSSHADQGQLMDWLKKMQGVQKVVLTHGEDGPRKVLAEKITADLEMREVILPTLNQEEVL